MATRMFLLFALIAWQPMTLSAKEVSSLGFGAIVDGNVSDARQQAIEDAKRVAVEQLFGSYISARTETRNFMLASEKIYSTTKGRIDSFDIIEESQYDQSTYQVKIKATIDEQSSLQAANEQLIKYNWLKKPRIALVEPDVDSTDGMVSKQVISRTFNASLTQQLKRAGFDVLNYRNESSIAPTFLLATNIEMLVQASQYQGMNIKTNEVVVATQLSIPHTGMVVSSGSESGAKAGADSLNAIKSVIDTIARRIAQRIVLDTKTAWVFEDTHPILLNINASQTNAVIISDTLAQAVVGITQTSVESVEKNRTSLLVQYKGWPEQLFDQLSVLSQQSDIPFAIEGAKGGVISLVTK